MTTVQQLKRQVENKHLGRPVNVSGSTVAPGLVIGFSIASMAGLGIAMSRYSYDVWAAFWIAPFLMLCCVPMANGAARFEADPVVGRIILGAAFFKVIIGTLARYATIGVAYNGGGDSGRYHIEGRTLAPLFRQLDFADLGKISGTRFIEVLTGFIYSITGATELGGFFIYSFMAFVGLFWMYRAFVIAFPDGDRARYRLLLFFFPTMWFWPSSIGKDAWMVFVLGMATYGLVKALDGDLRGLALVGLGLWGTVVVRPHLAAIFIVAASVGVIVRAVLGRTSGPSTARRGGGRVTAIILSVVIAGAAVVVSAQVQDKFNLDTLDVESAEAVLTETTDRTSQGGSQFDSPSPTNPIGFAIAAVTVQFRPFPFEATNLQALVSSFEGLFLLSLCVMAVARRVSQAPRLALRSPLVSFSVIWVLTFIYAFASIENFGILARQRAQLFPFLFVLLAIAAKRGHGHLESPVSTPDAGSTASRP